MGKMKDKLIEQYNIIIGDIITEFEKKHDVLFKDWIIDNDTLQFDEDLFVKLHDIIYDIEYNINKDVFLQWYEYNNSVATISYKAYVKSLNS